MNDQTAQQAARTALVTALTATTTPPPHVSDPVTQIILAQLVADDGLEATARRVVSLLAAALPTAALLSPSQVQP